MPALNPLFIFIGAPACPCGRLAKRLSADRVVGRVGNGLFVVHSVHNPGSHALDSLKMTHFPQADKK